MEAKETPRSFQYCVFFAGLPVPLFEGVFHIGGRGPEHCYFVSDENGAPLKVIETDRLAEMLVMGEAARFSRPTLTVSQRQMPGVPS